MHRDDGPFGDVAHIVTLMLENRSFDHMLGYLYPGNVTPSGQPFDGLTGNESCPGASRAPVRVYPIGLATANAYLMPGAGTGVDIAGGASTVRQALDAGVIDEFSLDIAPVLLGSAERIFHGVETFDFEPVEVLGSPLATHIRYRRRSTR